jgi:hypothetical protein
LNSVAARGALGERERADGLFEAWQARQSRRAATSDPAAWLHGQLLRAAYEVAPPEPARRRLAITTTGIPIVYSYKSARPPGASRFRLLAEPGGTGITVADQVRLSRDLLHRIVDHFGWQRAGARVDHVLGSLLPPNPDALSAWHGGLGFGMDVGDDGTELRVYCNVRHGELASRWQRLIGGVAEFADERAECTVREILDAAVPRAVPAGLALALADGEVRGIRLYAGLVDATAESAVAAAPAAFATSAPAINCLVGSYRSAFGELASQDLTLAYDFAIRGGILWPAMARFKVDLFCECANASRSGGVYEWIERVFEELGLPPSGLRTFLAELEVAFPGTTYQYVSLGCHEQAAEVTVYCVPGGCGTSGPMRG